MNTIYGRRSTCPAEQLRDQQRDFLDQHLTGEDGAKKTSAESVNSDGIPATAMERLQQAVSYTHLTLPTILLV